LTCFWPSGHCESIFRHAISINTFAAIDGFNRNQDADLRGNLDHEAGGGARTTKLAGMT
jgi:hypothetical protein